MMKMVNENKKLNLINYKKILMWRIKNGKI